MQHKLRHRVIDAVSLERNRLGATQFHDDPGMSRRAVVSERWRRVACIDRLRSETRNENTGEAAWATADVERSLSSRHTSRVSELFGQGA